MNKFFVNIGPNLASKIPHCKPEKLYSNVRNSFYFSKISTKEISDRILDLSIYKAKGPDNISISLLRKIRLLIVEPLTYIFNLCIKNGVFPDQMKVTNITPIYKNSGDLNDPSNFRPISLLPVIAKIFEKCIYVRLYKYLERFNFISNKQFGFRKNKNTEDAIRLLLSKISNKNEETSSVSEASASKN